MRELNDEWMNGTEIFRYTLVLLGWIGNWDVG